MERGLRLVFSAPAKVSMGALHKPQLKRIYHHRLLAGQLGPRLCLARRTFRLFFPKIDLNRTDGDRARPPKRLSSKKDNGMPVGTVKFYNTNKGFGFIAPEDGSKDVFVHATALEAAGMRGLVEGQKISFEVQEDRRSGKAAAANLQHP
jgi:CspA family cold shock protein